jgi:hypothetical protein
MQRPLGYVPEQFAVPAFFYVIQHVMFFCCVQSEKNGLEG